MGKRTTLFPVTWSNVNGQRGAVLLLVTFSLILIFGMAALTIDLGRMYIVKSQLQNAADAGALRAALILDTNGGLDAARAAGRDAARKNGFLLAADRLEEDSEIDVRFGLEPYGTFFDASGTGNTQGYYFAEVTVAKTGIASFFAGLIGVNENASSAVAVAGRYHIDVMPIAICAPDVNNCPNHTSGGTCGFKTGLGYPVSEVNPIGPGTFFWIDPEASGPGCSKCKYTSADDYRPYLCSGKSGPAVSGLVGSVVCTNTGKSSGPAFSAIDSRFGDYDPPGQCSPEVGAPDTNIREYVCLYGEKGCPKNATPTNVEADWMTPLAGVVNPAGKALQQSADVVDRGGDPQPPAMTINNEGVVWTFNRPTPPLNATRTVGAAYPATGTPYSQQSGKYFAAPPTSHKGKAITAVAKRRVVNMLIVKCYAAGGNCRDTEVQAIGEYFLTRKTNDSNEVHVEFSRIVSVEEFPTEIRLYR